MAFTLISIICITSAGASVIFKGNFCTILHPDESVIAKVTHTDGLYRLSANVAETINDDKYTLYANAARRPYRYSNSTVILATSIMELSKMQYEMVLSKDSKLTLKMLMSNFAKHVRLENLQHSHSRRSHSPVQVILERESIGTYGDLRV